MTTTPNTKTSVHPIERLINTLKANGFEDVSTNFISNKIFINVSKNKFYNSLTCCLAFPDDESIDIEYLYGHRVLAYDYKKLNRLNCQDCSSAEGWMITTERISMLPFDKACGTIKNPYTTDNSRTWQETNGKTPLEIFAAHIDPFIKILKRYKDKYTDLSSQDQYAKHNAKVQQQIEIFRMETDDFCSGINSDVKQWFGESGQASANTNISTSVDKNGKLTLTTTVYVGNAWTEDRDYCPTVDLHDSNGNALPVPDFMSLKDLDGNPLFDDGYGFCSFQIRKFISIAEPSKSEYFIKYNQFDNNGMDKVMPTQEKKYVYPCVLEQASFDQLFDYVTNVFNYDHEVYKLEKEYAQRRCNLTSAKWLVKHTV